MTPEKPRDLLLYAIGGSLVLSVVFPIIGSLIPYRHGVVLHALSIVLKINLVDFTLIAEQKLSAPQKGLALIQLATAALPGGINLI